ncbi:Hypothetical predicted protein [Olea europaea subsp. europaea]|uniref:Uncharacterized protein n=1 Tax=Olea europaea subsp. europaea TaxID=158383 RepID=A0A8S0RDX8_OLEEU|nr:Hypothetical predicted protein [Olea europaea subsp. europaea]
MMSVLGTKPGHQIRGMGDGRLRDICTSSNIHNLEKELETERAARKAVDATLAKMEQMIQYKTKVVEKYSILHYSLGVILCTSYVIKFVALLCPHLHHCQ